jgi:hypothetical protein
MEVLTHVSTSGLLYIFAQEILPVVGILTILAVSKPLKGQLCSSYVYWCDASCELQIAKQCSVIKGPQAWAIHYQDSCSLYCVSSVWTPEIQLLLSPAIY